MNKKRKKRFNWKMVAFLFLVMSIIVDVSNADVRKEINYPGDPNNVFHFIHITDTHISAEQVCGSGDWIYDRILAYANFQSLINDVLPTINPEFVVNTGDLVEEFAPLPLRNFEPHYLEWKEYEGLMYQLNARFPLSKYYDIPGNHDRYQDLGWDGEDAYPVENGYKYMGVRGSNSSYPGITNKSDENTEGQFHWVHLQGSDRYGFISINTCDETAVSSSEYNRSWIPDSEGGPLYDEDFYSDFPHINTTEIQYIDTKLNSFSGSSDSKLSFLFGHHSFRTEKEALVSLVDMVLPGLYDEEGKVVANWIALNGNRSEITLNSGKGFPDSGAAFIKTKGCAVEWNCWELFTWQGKNENVLTDCSYIPSESDLNEERIVYYNLHDRGRQGIIDLMNQYEVSAYFYGHTHFDHFDNDGLVHVYDENVLTINTGDLKSHGYYRIVAIDNGGLSTTMATLHEWPVILITAPVGKYFEHSGTKNPFRRSILASPSNVVRALGFGIGNNSGLEFCVEGPGLTCDANSSWTLMYPTGSVEHLYQGMWDSSKLYGTEYTIFVREIGGDSTKRFIKVDIVRPLPFIPLLLLAERSEPNTSNLPDTGVTKCYDSDDNEITCPQPGDPFYGQDANYGPNIHSYTKLDTQGNDLPPEAISWTMVRDNISALIWEKKTEDGGIHDKDNSYSWTDAINTFIESLNSNNFGGYSDWRLPTERELNFLANRGKLNPTIDETYFPNTKHERYYSDYWSSTKSKQYYGSYYGNVYFYGGYGDVNQMGDSGYVRAVRGDEFKNNFIGNGNGTVTDLTTGLMWLQKTINDDLNDKKNTYTWEEALFWITQLNQDNYAGYNDWRLPNINELVSIFNREFSPAINSTFFPNNNSSTKDAYYWSSTPSPWNSINNIAWGVAFFGSTYHDIESLEGTHFARAVRDNN